MDVKEYRRRYEAELASARGAAARPQGAGAAHSAADIPGLLATLRDSSQPSAARHAALSSLMAARFLGPRFAPYNAEFLATLRDILQPASDQDLRERAMEVLAIEKDAAAQDLLRRGLRDVRNALVPPAKALQFLGYDDHAEVTALARDWFARATDISTKEEALRLLATDPGSANLFAQLLTDKSQPRSLRALSAVGLHSLDPARFADLARAIVVDDRDYEDIRATALGTLAHMVDRLPARGHAEFVDRVRAFAATTPLQNLRAAADRFMKRQ
jgi:hypothetical protein